MHISLEVKQYPVNAKSQLRVRRQQLRRVKHCRQRKVVGVRVAHVDACRAGGTVDRCARQRNPSHLPLSISRSLYQSISINLYLSIYIYIYIDTRRLPRPRVNPEAAQQRRALPATQSGRRPSRPHRPTRRSSRRRQKRRAPGLRTRRRTNGHYKYASCQRLLP